MKTIFIIILVLLTIITANLSAQENKPSRLASDVIGSVYTNETEANGNNNVDWGEGDVSVFSAPVSIGSGAAQEKIVDLETDSNGVQYIAFIVSTKDTLKIMKSTNGGSNWFQMNSVFTFPGYNYQSFDMSVTDSANVFRLGFAVVINLATTGNTNTGELFWFSLRNDGSGFRSAYVRSRDFTFGWKSPSIISNGYYYDANLTYWYMAYTRVDSATGGISTLHMSYSTNWGYTWINSVVNSGFLPRNVSINVNRYFSTDSIYIAYSYSQLVPLPANSDLGLTKISLLNLFLSMSWTNTTFGTSNDETEPELAINKATNQMGLVYTLNTAGVKSVKYRYFTYPSGTYFSEAYNLDIPTPSQNRPRLICSDHDGKWRAAYCSKGIAFDTVIYCESSTNIAAGFSIGIYASTHNLAEAYAYPCVTGFKTAPGVFAGGVAFVRRTTNTLWYDASNIFPVRVTNTNSIVKNYSLSQNYPNPFNPTTNISYELPSAGYVSLKVFDMNGKEVASLVNQNQIQGSYSVKFNGAGLSSGIYFYKISTGDFVAVKKMILIK
jgi:hypothetical protein